jgi:nicotinate-nucleotide pyrophosphorylase (carboxylating)
LVNSNDKAAINEIILLALQEDQISQDLTSRLVVPESTEGRAVLQAKADGVVAGLDVFKEVYLAVDSSLKVVLLQDNGTRVKVGDIVAMLQGPLRAILAGERTALNFVCHLSGVATLTARYVAAVRDTAAVIVDTRKTLPGMRRFEKAAVAAGGGVNHRMDLADGILIKDNHIVAARASGRSLFELVSHVKHGAPEGLAVQVEVEGASQAQEAVFAGADMLLLDNMTPGQTAEIVARFGTQVKLESSGGINLDNVRSYAETGVQRISIGALTHSARALDLSLEIVHI